MTHLDLERMHPTFIIALIAALIIGSFIVSAISYSRQQALKKKKQMVKRYQQQADEALSYISVLLQIDEQYGLITQLQILVINALSSAARLNPDDRQLQSHLSTQNNKLNEYKGEQRPNEVYCWAMSYQQIRTYIKLTALQSKIILRPTSCI